MIKQAKKQHGEEKTVIGGRAPAGSWTAALSMKPEPVALRWVKAGEAQFPRLPGWKSPLWRVEAGRLELLRPEGRWWVSLEGAPEAFILRQEGAQGWMSKRGILALRESAGGAWFDQHGMAQEIERLDAEARAPRGLSELVQASGQWARWELTPEGKALGWLDDSFEHGPFSVRDRNPYLVVSDGGRKVAYWMGPSHWAWPMVERGMLLVCTGRGGGWEAERCYAPVLI